MLAFLLFFAIGAGCAYGYSERYFSGRAEGEYAVVGTVITATVHRNYSVLVLSELSLDGKRENGKLRLTVTEEGLRVGDILSFRTNVTRVKREDVFSTTQKQNDFISDVRFVCASDEVVKTATSASPFLRLNAALYDRLHEGMYEDEANVAYALLTGSGGNMDATLSDAIRKGGIAHVFAVSGLHIGILFSAAYLVCAPLKRWRFVPAALLAFGYCALCSFTVSSMRAAIMCTVVGGLKAMGRKRDFLESISLSAVILLILFPAEWLSVGFRLSFGACIGLALFSGRLTRIFKRLRLPNFLASYLASSFAVQLFTFPILIEYFHYFSLWGTLLNFFVIPALPMLFLGLILCALIALAIPVATPVLTLSGGMIALLSYAFSVADLTAVLSGFTLGLSGAVWLLGSVALSERFYLSKRGRAITAVCLSVLVAVCAVAQNCVFFGCKIIAVQRQSGSCVLVQTAHETVLVADGAVTASDCTDFLDTRYCGRLAATVVLEEQPSALNGVAFLPSECIYALDARHTGLVNKQVRFAEQFKVGELAFRFLSADRLLLYCENRAVEICFTKPEATYSDLFVSGEAHVYYLTEGNVFQR